MESKINIAELLKDCPSGMELDCTMYDNIYFDSIVEDCRYSIACYTIYEGIRTSIHFTEYGAFNIHGNSKCVIFPKGKTTWEGFHRPFKDGDVISDSNGICIFKGEGRIKGTVDYYCGVVCFSNTFRVKDNKSHPDGHYGNIVNYRFATEEEKQKLFDTIKANGYTWNAETKTLEKVIVPKFKVGDYVVHKGGINAPVLITGVSDEYYSSNFEDSIGVFCVKEQDDWELVPNKFDITTLKSFDRVLVRLDNSNQWYATLFSHIDERHEFCGRNVTVSGKSYIQMIPYEGNEHLCGTTNDCDDFYKTW